VFQGLRTAIYHVDDLAQAKAWYSTILGIAPYFDQPFYVGFNVAGYELGLQPKDTKTPNAGPTVVAYWGVADAKAALARLLQLGARLHEDVQDVGEGIKVASVTDPSGNVFGIIENPHFALPSQA
jgi:predicted enzyme related to lactoylglutathione lyase